MSSRTFPIWLWLVFAAVVGAWAISGAYGYRVSLLGSLAVAVALIAGFSWLLSRRARTD